LAVGSYIEETMEVMQQMSIQENSTLVWRTVKRDKRMPEASSMKYLGLIL
jgi:hypothetical protein